MEITLCQKSTEVLSVKEMRHLDARVGLTVITEPASASEIKTIFLFVITKELKKT